ncbi:MAG: cyclase family protein [Gammaproteobacteria bacterium]|nr:cyclase family protein [Gammaproteobacteria bacterium]
MNKILGISTALAASLSAAPAQAAEPGALAALIRDSELVDLTVTVSENYPAHWPTHNQFQRWTFTWFEPRPGPYSENPAVGEGHRSVDPAVPSAGPYYGQRFVIDEHTGTQADFPAHFIPPPTSKMPFASATGWLTGDKYPLRDQMGPAVVIDLRAIRDKAKNGFSPAVTVDMIKADEAKHGAIQAGDVVILYSGYSDAYYRPFPEGNRLAFDPLIAKSAPGWPAPTVEAVEYLAGKGVRHMATDGPSMGPVEGGQAVHVAFLKTGGSWTEFTTNLGKLPARGAYFISLSAKIVDGSGGLTRAIAIKPKGAAGLMEKP